MKKVSKLIISSVLLFSLAVPVVDAASVTVQRTSSNIMFKASSTFQGTGKYQKFTCTASGSSSSAGDCTVINKTKQTSQGNIYVGNGSPKTGSIDYFLNKGDTYVIQAIVNDNAPSGSLITATLNN